MTTELTAVEEIRRPSGLVQLHCVLSVFVWYESIKTSVRISINILSESICSFSIYHLKNVIRT